MPDIFEYASEAKEMDYARYFALAGLKLEASSATAPGGWIGLDTRTEEMPTGSPHVELLVTDVAGGSPAAAAGMVPGDRITSVDGTPAAAKVLSDAVKKGAGTKIRMQWRREGNETSAAVEVAPSVKKAYQLVIADGTADTQRRILTDWLRRGP